MIKIFFNSHVNNTVIHLYVFTACIITLDLTSSQCNMSAVYLSKCITVLYTTILNDQILLRLQYIRITFYRKEGTTLSHDSIYINSMLFSSLFVCLTGVSQYLFDEVHVVTKSLHAYACVRTIDLTYNMIIISLFCLYKYGSF